MKNNLPTGTLLRFGTVRIYSELIISYIEDGGSIILTVLDGQIGVSSCRADVVYDREDMMNRYPDLIIGNP